MKRYFEKKEKIITFSLFAIFLIIGISTFEIEDRYLTILVWFDYAITSFFVFEITIRFIGDKEKYLF